MATQFPPNLFPSIDWSILGDYPKTYAEGQARGREEQLRQALAGGLPRGPGGAIDYNAAVDLMARHGNISGVGTFANIAQQQAARAQAAQQHAETARHQKVLEGLRERELGMTAAERTAQHGFKEREVTIAEAAAREKPTYADWTDENTGKQWIRETLPFGQGMNLIDPSTGQRVSLWGGGAGGAQAPGAPAISSGTTTLSTGMTSPTPLAAQPSMGGPVATPPVTTPVVTPPSVTTGGPGAPPVARPDRPPPAPLPPIGVDPATFRKKGAEAAAEQVTADTELRSQGKQVLALADRFVKGLIDDPDDPKVAQKFSRAAGPYVSAAQQQEAVSINPVGMAARLAYEKSQRPEDKAHLRLIQQRAQAINSFMQKALLKGQGAIALPEREAIDRILGAIGAARNPTEATALMEQFKDIVQDLFKMREGSPLLKTPAARAVPPPPPGFTVPGQ